MILIIVAGIFIPAFEKVPSIMFPVLFSVASNLVVKTSQQTQIDKHLAIGGQLYPAWRVILISVVVTAIQLGLFFGLAYAVDSYQ